MQTGQPWIQIHPDDNVAVALTELKQGEVVSAGGQSIAILQQIDKGHKFALRPIEAQRHVVKYGYPIGYATQPIEAGEHVHIHNVATTLSGQLNYRYTPQLHPAERLPERSFMGYIRPDGRIGIRNEIWIVNTVGCVNKTAETIAKLAEARYGGKTDGIYAFSHPYGCSQLGGDHEMTQRILAGMVKHPNAGGVLVLGLGCENNHIAEFKNILGEYDARRVKFLSAQEVEDEIEAALALIGELADHVGTLKREPCPVSKLVVGLKCGGSDAFSGITANPLLGRFSDTLVALGGTTVLTEVPEMFGAETILMNRCINEDIFGKTVNLINDFKGYYMRYNQVIYENPSPGNKQGGITTLEEKSLGCTQKGGTSNVTDVVSYGCQVQTPGLNLLQGPGNDIVSVTALMAAGAHLILFTTGRGTPLGAPVPTVKVSSNTDLYRKKRGWIDFDAGTVLDGTPMQTVADGLFEYVIRLASGDERTRNEMNGYREIAIFKDGVTL